MALKSILFFITKKKKKKSLRKNLFEKFQHSKNNIICTQSCKVLQYFCIDIVIVLQWGSHVKSTMKNGDH
jgi:hypothetical protein